MTKALAPFLFLVLSIGLFFSYIKPAYEVLGAVREYESRVDGAIVKSKELKNRTSQLLEIYAEYERDAVSMKRLRQVLPDRVDFVRLIIDLDALAQKHNVRIMSIDLPRDDQLLRNKSVATDSEGMTVAQDTVSTARVQLAMEGQYDDIKSYLRAVEQSLTLLDVSAFSLSQPGFDVERESSKPTSGAVNGLQATMSIDTYWLN